jgi:hypothetical protein
MQNAAADPSHLWLDIDSFDIMPFPRIDPTVDPLNRDSLMESEYSFDEAAATEDSQTTRPPYGYGVEAQRSAPYRAYPMSRSPVLHLLRGSYDTITKEMLLRIIHASLRRCPESARPSPPTRAQRRMKAGLVSWLDENSTFMMCFLRSPMSGI